MQSDQGLREGLLGVLIRGVITRDYEAVMPEMLSRCGVSKASVSRHFAEASAESLRRLCERRFDGQSRLIREGLCLLHHCLGLIHPQPAAADAGGRHPAQHCASAASHIQHRADALAGQLGE